MGVYNNNKDGTRSTLANTIQVVDAPMEEFLSRGEFNAVTPNDVSVQNKLVAENEVTKAVDTMPTASASLVGTIVQYVGETTANYTNGYFYKCVSDGAVTPTYSWVEVISGGGSTYTAGSGIDINNNEISVDGFEVTGKYNVLDYELKGDNITDNTTMLQNLINTVPSGAVIYFPTGLYVIQNQIIIPNDKYILFLGETVACRHKNTKNIKYPESAIVIGNSFPTNTTAFVIQNGAYARMMFKGLSFYAHELYKITENTATYTTLPYSYFTVVNSANSEDNPQNLTRKVNCIEYPYYIEDCIFEGFSGYAIKTKIHKFVTNCTFLSCYIGIQASDTDCVIDKCWFNQGYIGVYLNNENSNYITAKINDCWCDAMSGYFIYGNNTSNNTLLINDAWVDMIDKSAVYIPNGFLNHAMINGRFSRCGMMYAGIEESQVTSEIRQNADVIVAQKFYNSELNIICDKRKIGGQGATKNNVCPYNLLYSIIEGAPNFNGVRVITDMSNSEIGYGNGNIEVHTLSGEDIESYKIYSYDVAKIHFRSGSPIGIIQAARPNMLCFDTTNEKWYRSTAANDNTAWEEIALNGILHYDTMPSTAELRVLPNNTYFYTKGYYTPTDGHGGFYSKNALWIPGSYEIPKINESDSRVWITCLDNPNNHIDLGKYGLRECPSKIMEFNRPTDVYMGSTTSLPTASASTENQVYEYTGNTVDPSPKKGYYYRCESTTTTVDGQEVTTYSWAEYQFYTTLENTYATANSDLFDKIYFSRMGSVFTIGAGKYFFARPLDLTSRNNGLKGDSAPYVWVQNQTTRGDFSSGTVLYFPFLTNGQTAIRTYWSSVSDLAIYGNPYIYNLDITRGTVSQSTGDMTKEPEVIETIAMDGANEIRCTGLNPHSGIIQNIYVNNFYTGIDVPTCNAELQSVFSRKCRNGVVIGNDVKCRGVFGWLTHTLLTFTGAIASAVQIRGDSLIHLINIQNGGKITISDADGDWCAKELVLIGKEDGRYSEVTGLRLNDVHGRCGGLHYYDSNALPNGYDVRTLSNIDGYGTIRVLPNARFKDSYISVNGLGGGLIDGDSRYKCTNIMFTQNTTGDIQGIYFTIPSLKTREDILKVVQTKADVTIRVDTSSGTYYIEGVNVAEDNPSTNIDFSTLLGG